MVRRVNVDKAKPEVTPQPLVIYQTLGFKVLVVVIGVAIGLIGLHHAIKSAPTTTSHLPITLGNGALPMCDSQEGLNAVREIIEGNEVSGEKVRVIAIRGILPAIEADQDHVKCFATDVITTHAEMGLAYCFKWIDKQSGQYLTTLGRPDQCRAVPDEKVASIEEAYSPKTAHSNDTAVISDEISSVEDPWLEPKPPSECLKIYDEVKEEFKKSGYELSNLTDLENVTPHATGIPIWCNATAHTDRGSFRIDYHVEMGDNVTPDKTLICDLESRKYLNSKSGWLNSSCGK